MSLVTFIHFLNRDNRFLNHIRLGHAWAQAREDRKHHKTNKQGSFYNFRLGCPARTWCAGFIYICFNFIYTFIFAHLG